MGEAAGVPSRADARLLELEARLARVARLRAVLGLVPGLAAVEAVERLDRARLGVVPEPEWTNVVESATLEAARSSIRGRGCTFRG